MNSTVIIVKQSNVMMLTGRYVCRIGYETPGTKPECLTCNMSSSCRYVSADFGRNAKYYLLNCRGPDLPVCYLRSSHNASDGKAPGQRLASLQAIWAWSCLTPLQKYCAFPLKIDYLCSMYILHCFVICYL